MFKIKQNITCLCGKFFLNSLCWQFYETPWRALFSKYGNMSFSDSAEHIINEIAEELGLLEVRKPFGMPPNMIQNWIDTSSLLKCENSSEFTDRKDTKQLTDSYLQSGLNNKMSFDNERNENINLKLKRSSSNESAIHNECDEMFTSKFDFSKKDSSQSQSKLRYKKLYTAPKSPISLKFDEGNSPPKFRTFLPKEPTHQNNKSEHFNHNNENSTMLETCFTSDGSKNEAKTYYHPINKFINATNKQFVDRSFIISVKTYKNKRKDLSNNFKKLNLLKLKLINAKEQARSKQISRRRNNVNTRLKTAKDIQISETNNRNSKILNSTMLSMSQNNTQKIRKKCYTKRKNSVKTKLTNLNDKGIQSAIQLSPEKLINEGNSFESCNKSSGNTAFDLISNTISSRNDTASKLIPISSEDDDTEATDNDVKLSTKKTHSEAKRKSHEQYLFSDFDDTDTEFNTYLLKKDKLSAMSFMPGFSHLQI